jgi:hypothetical protein
VPSAPVSPGKTGDAKPLDQGPSPELKTMIEDLVRDGENPHDLLIAELRRVKAVSWRMPNGFRTRLSHTYIAQAMRGGRKMVEFSKEWIRDHALEHNSYGQEHLRLARKVDEYLFEDRVEGFLNLVGTERLCRRMRGLEVAHEAVKTEADWRKPKGANASWKPRTNWREADLVDPSHLPDNTIDLLENEEEVQKAREKKALLLKAQQKVTTLAGSAPDPRDLLGPTGS